ADAESIATAALHHRPSHLIGRLRAALAMAVFRDLRPDLLIFDEFQKFRELLIDPLPKPGSPTVPPDPLIRALRGGVRRDDPALLLLSATPYRPYSTRQDEATGISHHQDFFELIRFLFCSDTDAPA